MSRIAWIPAGSVAFIALLALAAPLLPLPDPVAIDVAHRLAGSSALHPLGQDEYGRDARAWSGERGCRWRLP
jgi:peptide/nickel transport system permease protein